MPKQGFLLADVPKLFSTANDKPGWALCIGAGTSVPLFPDWYSLGSEMAKQLVPETPFDVEALKKSGFSPDSMIQMVKNATDLNDLEFTMRMSNILYHKLQSKISVEDWNDVVDVLGANNISNCSMKKWRLFSSYRDTVLKETTAYQLAIAIMESIKQHNAPQCILSFNAEPLLFAMLNSLLADGRKQPPKKVFSKVISSISGGGLGTIPYVFCHGLLPITTNPHKFSTSIDKLVFLEEEYLHLANNSFSWQSTTFINTCISQHIVFVGTSLTDPNMRRWLSWTHANRLDEMRQNGIDIKDSTQHYWIRTIPNDKNTMPWIEAVVSHLGVRIVWIDNWSQVGLALNKMLGISKKSPPPTRTKKGKDTFRKRPNKKQSRHVTARDRLRGLSASNSKRHSL